MKALWKGTISFGLVNIPIGLYLAVQHHSLGFKMLHSECMTPISLKRWCNHCNKEVSLDEIVKGLKLPDGTYFVATKENLNKLKPAKSDNLNIVQFIDKNQLTSLYLDNHYYALPQRKTDKAFFLFIAALSKMEKVAIGNFVMREKEYLCSIEPYKKGILLSTLNYAYEIKELRELDELEVPKIDSNELKLAEQLINALYVKEFDITKFKDTYAEKLMDAIKKVAKGIAIPEKEVRIRHKEEPSLIEALKASLKLDKEGRVDSHAQKA